MTQPEEKYKSLIDKQTWDFIRQTDQWYPPETINYSMQQQRQTYDAMCREFHHGYPAGIMATDSTIATDEYKIPVRRYAYTSEYNAATIIYFHGGGFVVGGLESHDGVCADLCAATRLNVTAVDYRLAPEYLHPAAFNDALASVVHEYQQTDKPLILCGDSAGGNLAAAVCHTLRDSNTYGNIRIAGQVLIYPGLGGDVSRGSYVTHANAPMLTTRDVKIYSTIRTGRKEQTAITSLMPLLDDNFSGLPETVAFSAQCDPLADDSQHYVQAITSAGGKATWVNEEGMVHGYLRARHTVDRARDSFKRITDSITRLV